LSIKVENIIKTYGAQQALGGVSFEVATGSVVGFLGPNGAGKSTMMKILTCFIPQTSGKAWVSGFDVEEDSLKVRQQVGYLPESNPLYHDMYVKEYLEFIGGIHKLKGLKQRVKEMISITGLELEQAKKIGALSKGYKQRVGLAQAMIHDPQVLILDEPTSGLDPNQLVEIRNLIKTIGKEKTVMLSTHIMQEVEAMCDRVIIINRGKIVTDQQTEELQKGDINKQVITVEFDKETNRNALRKIDGVEEAHHVKGTTWKILASGKVDIRPSIFQYAVEHKLTVLTLQKEEVKLEDVFKELTKEK
jgi:ABC-2 type transport system ATP-binding protein